MLRQRRLAEAQRLLQRADRPLALRELAQHGQPVAVGDRLQERLDRLGPGLQPVQIHA